MGEGVSDMHFQGYGVGGFGLRNIDGVGFWL